VRAGHRNALQSPLKRLGNADRCQTPKGPVLFWRFAATEEATGFVIRQYSEVHVWSADRAHRFLDQKSRPQEAHERRLREAGATVTKRKAPKGKRPGGHAQEARKRILCCYSEGSNLRSRTRRLRAASNGTEGATSATKSDLRAAKSPEGESSGALPGCKKPGSESSVGPRGQVR